MLQAARRRRSPVTAEHMLGRLRRGARLRGAVLVAQLLKGAAPPCCITGASWHPRPPRGATPAALRGGGAGDVQLAGRHDRVAVRRVRGPRARRGLPGAEARPAQTAAAKTAERQAQAIPLVVPQAYWTNSEIPLLDRAFAAMAYDTAAPANELVGLNVEDLDLANKKAVIVGKGGKRRAHLLVLGHRPAAPAACPQAHHGAPVPGPSCPVTGPPGGRRRRLPAHRSGQAVLRAHRRAVQAAVRGVDPAQAPP
jgi:hypothetical protein